MEDRVLKKPGALTPEEFTLMKQHTVKGANIMRPVSQLKDMLPGIELHHEHMDGRGYPYGLNGPQIPMMARIIGVADTLDAMTTNRPYQSAMDLDYALGKIKALAGSKFDTVVVNALDAAVTEWKITPQRRRSSGLKATRVGVIHRSQRGPSHSAKLRVKDFRLPCDWRAVELREREPLIIRLCPDAASEPPRW